MKIGIVFDDTFDTPDGVQQYIKTLGRWLLDQGHDVKFLMGESTDDSEFPGRVISLSRNMTFKGNENTMTTPYLPYVRKMRKVLKAEKFDVLHVQIPFSPMMAQILIALANVPRIGTFHSLSSGAGTTLGFNIISVIQRTSLDKFYKILTVSPAAQKFAKKSFGIESQVVPNMVNLEKFQKGKSIKKYRDGKVNIFFLGRLVKRKGVIYLLKAYKELLKRIDSDKVRLLIAGKGELKAELEKYVKDNKLKNVEFLGFVPEEMKADYYATADISTFPATGGESFGIVLLEAMAANSAIVAGDNPGYKSVLRGMGSFLLVDPKDTVQYADKLEALVEDKDLRNKFAQWGKGHVDNYEVDKVGNQIVEIYKQAQKKRIKKTTAQKIARPFIEVPKFFGYTLVKGIYKVFSRMASKGKD